MNDIIEKINPTSKLESAKLESAKSNNQSAELESAKSNIKSAELESAELESAKSNIKSAELEEVFNKLNIKSAKLNIKSAKLYKKKIMDNAVYGFFILYFTIISLALINKIFFSIFY